jgi:hypothetical protein
VLCSVPPQYHSVVGCDWVCFACTSITVQSGRHNSWVAQRRQCNTSQPTPQPAYACPCTYSLPIQAQTRCCCRAPQQVHQLPSPLGACGPQTQRQAQAAAAVAAAAVAAAVAAAAGLGCLWSTDTEAGAGSSSSSSLAGQGNPCPPTSGPPVESAQQ